MREKKKKKKEKKEKRKAKKKKKKKKRSRIHSITFPNWDKLHFHIVTVKFLQETLNIN